MICKLRDIFVFNVADQPEFKTVICLLQPGYTAPNREKLANSLLEAVFEEVNQKTATELNDRGDVDSGWLE